MKQEDLIEAMWRSYLRNDAPMDDGVLARQDEACIAHDAIERIGAPTLVVCGEGDILTRPCSRVRSPRIKDSRLVMLSNAGHLVAAELAPRSNRLVIRFLAEQERGQVRACERFLAVVHATCAGVVPAETRLPHAARGAGQPAHRGSVSAPCSTAMSMSRCDRAE